MAVHPHGRGDNLSITSALGGARGSPPRAWGQCQRALGGGGFMAVHPHGRGDNGRRRLTRSVIPTVHPHGRGDNLLASLIPLA